MINSVRKLPITREECGNGKKFLYQRGEVFSNGSGDYIVWEAKRLGQITWVEDPFYGDIPGPKFGGSELVHFNPETGIYSRYEGWSGHVARIYED